LEYIDVGGHWSIFKRVDSLSWIASEDGFGVVQTGFPQPTTLVMVCNARGHVRAARSIQAWLLD
jgi:hypothetical protein